VVKLSPSEQQKYDELIAFRNKFLLRMNIQLGGSLDGWQQFIKSKRTLIFTDDNATVYRVSRDFLIPSITHQTPTKERHAVLEKFRSSAYQVLVTSRLLNEGVDVSEASVAVSNQDHAHLAWRNAVEVAVCGSDGHWPHQAPYQLTCQNRPG